MHVAHRFGARISSYLWFLFLLAPLAPQNAAPFEALPEYREPPAAVTALLTAERPAEFMLHPPSRRVALLYHESTIGMERLQRRLG